MLQTCWSVSNGTNTQTFRSYPTGILSLLPPPSSQTGQTVVFSSTVSASTWHPPTHTPPPIPQLFLGSRLCFQLPSLLKKSLVLFWFCSSNKTCYLLQSAIELTVQPKENKLYSPGWPETWQISYLSLQRYNYRCAQLDTTCMVHHHSETQVLVNLVFLNQYNLGVSVGQSRVSKHGCLRGSRNLFQFWRLESKVRVLHAGFWWELSWFAYGCLLYISSCGRGEKETSLFCPFIMI